MADPVIVIASAGFSNIKTSGWSETKDRLIR